MFAGGACLLERAVDTARLVGGQILVTTDYAISALPEGIRAYYVPRPAHLATAQASMLGVLWDLGDKCAWDEHDQIVLLQPTSLAGPHQTRYEAIQPWLAERRSVVSAWRVPERWHPWYCMDPTAPHPPPPCRQGIPARYRPNGLFYVMNGRTARAGRLWHEPLVFAEGDCYNIDTPVDWAEAERAYG